jgi:hypothetical protein
MNSKIPSVSASGFDRDLNSSAIEDRYSSTGTVADAGIHRYIRQVERDVATKSRKKLVNLTR